MFHGTKFFLLLFVLVSTQSFAGLRQRNYLSSDNLIFEKITPPYPAEGSSDLENDWKIVFDYQKNRTATECSIADGESNPNAKGYFLDPLFNFLTSNEKTLLSNFYFKVESDTMSVDENIKQIYDRKRPFEQNNMVKPCILKPKGKSYPSGHATIGMVASYALSDIFPELKEKLIARGIQYGKNRILGGVHFPSDVKMGQTLAATIIEEMRKSKSYQNDVLTLKNSFHK